MLYNILDYLEQKISFCQGRGYVASLSKEFSRSCSFLTHEPSVIVDVGGNKGAYSAEILRLFPEVELHIFEPSSKNLQSLRELYGNRRNVQVVDKALSDDVGVAELYADEDGSGMSSLIQRNLEHFGLSFECQQFVETVRFEDYWSTVLSQRIIDFIKIDVEGNEMRVLNGFGAAIEKIRVIQFEFGGTCIDARVFFQDYWRFFLESNFDIYRITPFGVRKLDKYRECEEVFYYTNYIAVNRNKEF